MMTTKKNITSYNKDFKQHGYWEKYHYNGKLHFKGHYVNNKKNGYWEIYYDNGNPSLKGNFINDNPNNYVEKYSREKLIIKEFFI